MKEQKIVANLGKNGISTVWTYVLCTYLALISMISIIISEDWAENLSILGTIPEALLWYWICRRLFSEQKMEKDMYILIMISYGMVLLSEVFLFFRETETAGYIFSFICLVAVIIWEILILIRYDGAMKKYAIWSIICCVGLNIAFLIFGDPSEMDVTGGDRIIMKYLVIPLSVWPDVVLIDVLCEGDEDEYSGENDGEEVPAAEIKAESNA